ncbi:hypothetical protein RM190_13990 [Paracoccus sp. CPCC 101403]|uniref:Uncharacterized protein n=2 Tax=Paracoccus broussonetiae TaxID=3075834 RepID=A0ABU3EFG1_9RHOB|nr:hypothetical protein [Paracoccus sp. CPCC 101403]MDT1062986.1 hypothetical protein [Paracoccus sp. CPCC 101403]
MNRIGLGLMAASAAAMIAGDAFAGPFTPTSQKFYLSFSTFAPTDIKCNAEGPGVRTNVTRNVAGKPMLRVTGNAKGALITCWRADGTRYTTDANRRVKYNTASPVYAMVYFDGGSDEMSVEITRDNLDDRALPTILPRAFTRVK